MGIIFRKGIETLLERVDSYTFSFFMGFVLQHPKRCLPNLVWCTTYVMFYQILHKILSNALIFWNGTIYQKLKFFLTSGKDHPRWLLTKMDQMMDQFSDINEGEKEFMKMWNLHMMVILILEYRNGAINSRSWKVAAPLIFQAKTHFLCVFYEVI